MRLPLYRLSFYAILSIITILNCIGQEIQSPSRFLGYELGEKFTFHHTMLSYLAHIERFSKEIKLVQYGTSYESRPLVTAFISSEENLKKIEEIRLNSRKSTGLDKGNIEGLHLPIIWLSYNIHGDEAASMEAAMQTVYQLLNEKDKNKEWLAHLLIVLDPCLNPDGHERYTNWFYRQSSKITNPNPVAWEHHQPWPGGRFNHYIFDLNRDWAWQIQKESAERIIHYRKFMPQIHVDFHEMSSEKTYFFPPSAKPHHEGITKWQIDFQKYVAKNHAKYFDEQGWLFFTQEVYDLLYPSYGDTYPIFNGALGFTYEQGGGGRAGTALTTTQGDTLTLKERIAHHHTTAISTIEMVFAQRDKILKEFKQYFKNSVEKPNGKYQSYVIKASKMTDNIKSLITLLDKHEIKYGNPQETGTFSGYSYNTQNKNERFTVSESDIVINTRQPMSNLIKVLFEPETIIEDSLTYDLTAWAIPYAYHLDTYATNALISIKNDAIVKNILSPTFTPNSYAYLFEWSDFADAKIVSYLLQKGIKVRYSEKNITLNGNIHQRGALIITKNDNKNMLQGLFENMIKEASSKFDKPVFSILSGLGDDGTDIGASSAKLINMPKVALIGGEQTSPTSFGEIWHFFEEELNYPITVIGTEYLQNVELQQFNVLIIPSGNYQKLNMNQKIEDFTRKGGRVIVLGDAIKQFVGSNIEDNQKTTKSTDEKKVITTKKYADRIREQLSHKIAGSIYKITLDETHPLAFGLGKTLFLIKNNEIPLPLLNSNNSWNVGVFQDDCYVSGFSGNVVKGKINNTTAIGVENNGNGEFIYMTDSPIIRGFWYSGKLLLANSIFFKIK